MRRVQVFWCQKKQAEVLCDRTGWLEDERSCGEAVKALGQHFSPSSLAMRYCSQNKEWRPDACRCHLDRRWLRHGLEAAAVQLGADGRETTPAGKEPSSPVRPLAPSQVAGFSNIFRLLLHITPSFTSSCSPQALGSLLPAPKTPEPNHAVVFTPSGATRSTTQLSALTPWRQPISAARWFPP